MNAGLGTLTALKAQLLPATQRDGTKWDDLILGLGLGVAASFDRHCNRLLGWAADDT